MNALIIGFGLGFLVAMQLGPISLFAIRSTLRGSLQTGLAIGAGVLVWIGARTLHSAFRIRAGLEADDEVASPRQAFLTTLAATASNPLTIISWAAIFAAASAADAAQGIGGAALLVGGVAIGSLAWMTILALGVSAARKRIGPRLLRAIDLGAGGAIVGFGAVLGYRTLHGD